MISFNYNKNTGKDNFDFSCITVCLPWYFALVKSFWGNCMYLPLSSAFFACTIFIIY